MSLFDEPSVPPRIGPYRIDRLLAAGGMGEVLLGWDEGLNRPVALKRLRASSRTDPKRRERFRREARCAASLDHSAIVRVYEFLEEEDGLCIVMEYIEGTTLRRALREGPMPIRLALDLAISLADALAIAHENGVVHRDLKTENVMFTKGARVKITDFGIAKRMLRDEGSLTQSAVLLGTCRSMAPEQALGEPVGPRSDLFSFGVLLYETLTGVSPFEDKNDLLTLRRLTAEPHRPVRELRPEIPEALADLIDELLEKDPADRPERGADVVMRLVDLLHGYDAVPSSAPLSAFSKRLRAAFGR
ncbi:MAG: serine/threonine-protein kinase [Acidobacteriota bacterium]